MYLMLNASLMKNLKDNNSKKILKNIMELNGIVHRHVAQRKTIELEFNDKSIFIKQHFGIGWVEIFKNLIKLKLPTLGAKTEYNAINAFNKVGIPTIIALGFGEKGLNPAKQQSFLITKKLNNTISLEDLARNWIDNPPSLMFKRALIKKVAHITGKMHGSGMNHRDLYLAHFLIDKFHADNEIIPDKLTLIDLHRVQIRKNVPKRWLIKDLSGLYFSSLEAGLSRTDIFIFLKEYYNTLYAVKENRFCSYRLNEIKMPIRKIKNASFNLYCKLNKNQMDHRKIKLLLRQFTDSAKIRKIIALENKVINKFMKKLMHSDEIVCWRKTFRKKIAISKNFDPKCEDIQRFISNPGLYLKNLEKQNDNYFIKNEEKTTVVKTKFANQTVIIKRYNVRTFWYFLRKCYHPMNAKISFRNTFLLKWLNIPTPEPILMIKECFGCLPFRSYFIMQYIESQPFEAIYSKNKALISKSLLEQSLDFLKTLHQVNYIHGDFYPRNLLVKDNQVWFIDVDKTRPIKRKKRRIKLQQRDTNNFINALTTQPS